jgi:hypothetical protein
MLKVSKEIEEATTDCTKGFTCLAGDGTDLCKVTSSVNDEIHFVICLNEEDCTYKRSSGGRLNCGCPVRREIFNKYKT